ncbi:unnamed protein product, partial [Prorocentrum cordatum]
DSRCSRTRSPSASQSRSMPWMSMRDRPLLCKKKSQTSASKWSSTVRPLRRHLSPLASIVRLIRPKLPWRLRSWLGSGARAKRSAPSSPSSTSARMTATSALSTPFPPRSFRSRSRVLLARPTA